MLLALNKLLYENHENGIGNCQTTSSVSGCEIFTIAVTFSLTMNRFVGTLLIGTPLCMQLTCAKPKFRTPFSPLLGNRRRECIHNANPRFQQCGSTSCMRNISRLSKPIPRFRRSGFVSPSHRFMYQTRPNYFIQTVR